MSLKAELTTWSNALKAYEQGDYDLSIAEFEKIGDTSKIQWNIGIILATQGKHEEAIKRFYDAITSDMYFTVAYHQAGVSNFMLGKYEAALKDFEDALTYLRGNQTINYEQLGLDFRLYSAEVLFNCGLSKIYIGQTESGMTDLREASSQKVIDEHKVIDDAIRDQGRDYNVFSVPVGALFKPSANKLKNLATRDYMGKAVLVAATEVNDAYTSFTGITRLKRGQNPSGAPLDASHPLGRSASISAIPKPQYLSSSGFDFASGDRSPIGGRMTRSNTVGIVPLSSSGGGSAELGRSMTSANGANRNNNNDRPSVRITTDLSAPISTSTSSRGIASAPVNAPFNPLLRPSRSPVPPYTTTSTSKPDLSPYPYPAAGRPSHEARKPSTESESSRDSPAMLKTPLERDIVRQQSLAITELYDDYYKSTSADAQTKSGGTYDITFDVDEYPGDLPQLPPLRTRSPGYFGGGGGGGHNNTAKAAPPGTATPSILMRKGSASASASAGQPQLQRRPTMGVPRDVRAQGPGQAGQRGEFTSTMYSEDSAGNNRVSNYQDMLGPGDNGLFFDMAKVRVKVNFGSVKRGMSILPTHTYETFLQSLRERFPHPTTQDSELKIRFKDEDGDMLSMLDEGDFEAAIDVARVLGQGRGEGRLEIWVD
ncbi:hypothetical protein I317_03125 [Kwoniella heveanensis CBS 569]|nr:hypothetical protein I317_03125 [Kwoniella heveanensis CBS 569]